MRKARKIDPTSLEAGYNEGLLLDVLGRYDEAAATFEKLVEQTSHANGAYKEDEKNNRSIFLERLGGVYREQNKVEQAIAAYQKVIEMGGVWLCPAMTHYLGDELAPKFIYGKISATG